MGQRTGGLKASFRLSALGLGPQPRPSASAPVDISALARTGPHRDPRAESMQGRIDHAHALTARTALAQSLCMVLASRANGTTARAQPGPLRRIRSIPAADLSRHTNRRLKRRIASIGSRAHCGDPSRSHTRGACDAANPPSRSRYEGPSSPYAGRAGAAPVYGSCFRLATAGAARDAALRASAQQPRPSVARWRRAEG